MTNRIFEINAYLYTEAPVLGKVEWKVEKVEKLLGLS
jgi:hypothetical protein